VGAHLTGQPDPVTLDQEARQLPGLPVSGLGPIVGKFHKTTTETEEWVVLPFLTL